MNKFQEISLLIKLAMSTSIIEKANNSQQIVKWHDWYQKNAIPVINGLEEEIQINKQTRSSLLKSPNNDTTRQELSVVNNILERKENFSGFLQIFKTHADYADLFSRGQFIQAHDMLERTLADRKHQAVFRSIRRLDNTFTAQHYLYLGEALLANIAHGGKQISADDSEIAKSWFYRAEKIVGSSNPHVAFAQGWNAWLKGNTEDMEKAISHIKAKGSEAVECESGQTKNQWFYKHVPAEYKKIIARPSRKMQAVAAKR